MPKRVFGAIATFACLALLPTPTAGAAPAWHYVGRVQERSDYRSVGGDRVSHEYGMLVHDGTRTVWQTVANGNRTAWHITFSVPSAPNPTRSRQRVCPVVRAIGTQAPTLSVHVMGTKPGDPGLTIIEISSFILFPGTTYQRLCATYNLMRSAWDSLIFDLVVSGHGTVRVDQLRLYQGGSTGPSVIAEVAQKPNG